MCCLITRFMLLVIGICSHGLMYFGCCRPMRSISWKQGTAWSNFIVWYLYLFFFSFFLLHSYEQWYPSQISCSCLWKDNAKCRRSIQYKWFSAQKQQKQRTWELAFSSKHFSWKSLELRASGLGREHNIEEGSSTGWKKGDWKVVQTYVWNPIDNSTVNHSVKVIKIKKISSHYRQYQGICTLSLCSFLWTCWKPELTLKGHRTEFWLKLSHE